VGDSLFESLKLLPVDGVPFCSLDFETTQIPGSSKELAIIEIGAQCFMGDKLSSQSFQHLINPKCDIRTYDTGVSGINNKMVEECPTFVDIYPSFSDYIEGHILIAHNASFDKRALENQCIRDKCKAPDNPYIDTATLLRKAIDLPSYTLESAAKHFGLKQVQSHRALDDCTLVIKIFWAILTFLKTKYGVSRMVDLYQLGRVKSPTYNDQKKLFDI
jgi:DNA polymerase III epsilon subunit family exonuclease